MSPSRLRPALAVAAALVSVVALAACSAGEQSGRSTDARAPSAATSGTPRATSAAPGHLPGASTYDEGPRVYVAVGASETVGVGADAPDEAWPRVLRDAALPGSRLVNVGVSGATVEQALASQLPRALAADPDVVTVWLVVNDILSLVPVTTYERRLQRLVRALRQGGRTEVLVGNAPQIWRLPAYRACLPASNGTEVPCLLTLVPEEALVRATVADFNAAVARVVRAEGATAVDLSDRGALTGLTSSDGFHPSTRGHARIAGAFAGALRE